MITTRYTSICTTLTLLLTVATLASAPPAAAGDLTFDRLRSIGMTTVAAEFGDAEGHIVVNGSTSDPSVLARGGAGEYKIYTAGDEIGPTDQFALCSLEFESCEPLRTEFTCHEDPENGDWCECFDLIDCVLMVLADVCTEEPTCMGGECACV